MKTYIRFERGRDDLPWLTFGPFDFVQLTYNFVRISEETQGDHFAFFNKDGEWEIMADSAMPADSPYRKYVGERYSDIVIFAADPAQVNLDEENKWYNDTPNAHETACIFDA